MGLNTISNWLFTPTVTLKNGDVLTFYTRKVTPDPTDYPNRIAGQNEYEWGERKRRGYQHLGG